MCPVNFGFKIAILGKNHRKKWCVCKIDEEAFDDSAAATRSQSSSQQYIVTNHLEVIMVTNSEKWD